MLPCPELPGWLPFSEQQSKEWENKVPWLWPGEELLPVYQYFAFIVRRTWTELAKASAKATTCREGWCELRGIALLSEVQGVERGRRACLHYSSTLKKETENLCIHDWYSFAEGQENWRMTPFIIFIFPKSYQQAFSWCHLLAELTWSGWADLRREPVPKRKHSA